MNDPLFKNSFIRNKSTSTEIVKYMLLLTRLMKILYVVAAISFVINLAFILIDVFNPNIKIVPENYFSTVITYVFPAILLALMCFVTKARNTPKGGTSEESFIVTEDEIMWTSEGKELTLAIEKIAFYYNTKNYFLIIPNTKGVIIPAIKKDSFTLGSSDEFLGFLKSKGIKEQK